MMMMPWLVVSAQEEWILVPTKYRLSKTLYGGVYHVARSGTTGRWRRSVGAGTTCTAASTASAAKVVGRDADAHERARVILARCALGRGDETVGRGRRRCLRVSCGRGGNHGS